MTTTECKIVYWVKAEVDGEITNTSLGVWSNFKKAKKVCDNANSITNNSLLTLRYKVVSGVELVDFKTL